LTRSDLQPDVCAFLEQFTAAGKSLDPRAQRRCWAETFLSLDPNRATPVPREEMLAVLHRRREMFASIGATSSDLIDAQEMPLDERHTIVRTTWRWRLEHADESDDELVLQSTFLLRREETGWRIVVYLNHQDVGALITERASRRVV
jgi:NTF2-like protein (DUF6841)